MALEQPLHHSQYTNVSVCLRTDSQLPHERRANVSFSELAHRCGDVFVCSDTSFKSHMTNLEHNWDKQLIHFWDRKHHILHTLMLTEAKIWHKWFAMNLWIMICYVCGYTFVEIKSNGVITEKITALFTSYSKQKIF